MFGLTSLGMFHTAISVFAVSAGVVALVRYHAIGPDTRAGRIYIALTIVTCLTGFGIFEHGGFGKPHALGVITLATLAVAFLAAHSRLLGDLAPYVERVAYSLTFFFHIIPAMAESATRLPLGTPLLQSPEDPALQAANGICFLLFLIGATFQVRAIRRLHRQSPGIHGLGSRG